MTVVAVGENLRDKYKVGDRFIIQADIYVKGVGYAYGYEMDGGFSHYGLIDERVLQGDEGNYLLSVQPDKGYAESALTEPWACVIAANRLSYRTALKHGGTTWIIGTGDARDYTISAGFDGVSHPATLLLARVPSVFAAWLRERAARVLCLAAPAAPWRIAQAAQGDRAIIQSLLQAPGLAPEALVELGAWLIANRGFTMNQFGLPALAEKGLMPGSFVPSQFAAADQDTQRELCRFAEAQLGQADDEHLHRFLLRVVYGDHPAEIRSAAWWSLHRWYRQGGEIRGEGPLRLERAAIERFFDSVAIFVPKLTAVLGDHAALKEVGLYEHLANLLGYADEGIGRLIVAEEPAAHDLVRALLRIVAEPDYYAFLRSGAAKLLAQFVHHPRWRDEVRQVAKRVLDAGTSMHYELTRLVEG